MAVGGSNVRCANTGGFVGSRSVEAWTECNPLTREEQLLDYEMHPIQPGTEEYARLGDICWRPYGTVPVRLNSDPVRADEELRNWVERVAIP